MRKIEIADLVASKADLTKSQAIDAVDAVFNVISESLANGESVYIRGFATFKSVIRKSKKARNISEGTTVIVPARHTAKLIVSKYLMWQMNKD